MAEKVIGFAPFYNFDSRVLILGSFPSVQSRKVDFYYGNKQNRFWKMLFGFFGERVKDSTEEKKRFLTEKKIALWDIVQSCEIEGSADASIKKYEIAQIERVLSFSPIEKILLNGTKAYSVFCEKYKDSSFPYALMPSTSPANVRYDESIWHKALADIFEKEKL